VRPSAPCPLLLLLPLIHLTPPPHLLLLRILLLRSIVLRVLIGVWVGHRARKS